MPYRHDREAALWRQGDEVLVRARGIDLTGAVVVDEPPRLPDPDSLGAFALERYVAYGRLPGGFTYSVEVRHPSWRARAVAVERAVLLGHGPLEGPVAAHAAEEVEVEVARVHRVPGRTSRADLLFDARAE